MAADHLPSYLCPIKFGLSELLMEERNLYSLGMSKNLGTWGQKGA